MIHPEKGSPGVRPQSRRLTRWVASGIVVIVAVVVAVVVLANGDDEASFEDPVASTTSSAQPTPQVDPPDPPPTSSSEEVAEPAPTVDPWEEVPILFYSGPEGVYRTGNGFFAQFQVALPEGWARAFPELPDIVELSPSPEACETDQASAACTGLITVVDVGQATVEEAVTLITTSAGVSSSEPVPAELGDASGVRFEMWTDELLATVATIADGGRVVMNRTRAFLTYVLDVEGQTVTMFVDSPAEASMLELAQPVLDSIVWRDLG